MAEKEAAVSFLDCFITFLYHNKCARNVQWLVQEVREKVGPWILRQFIYHDKSCKTMEIIQLMSCASWMKKWNWSLTTATLCFHACNVDDEEIISLNVVVKNSLIWFSHFSLYHSLLKLSYWVLKFLTRITERMPVILGDKEATDTWLSVSSNSKFDTVLKPYEHSDLVRALFV